MTFFVFVQVNIEKLKIFDIIVSGDMNEMVRSGDHDPVGMC